MMYKMLCLEAIFLKLTKKDHCLMEHNKMLPGLTPCPF